jgi:hypothetical protein
MLGISIYLSHENIEKNEQWIAKAKSYGFRSIFTSLHIPEDNSSSYKELLQGLGKQAMAHDMELMADISPKSLSYLGLNYNTITELIRWGVSGLRVDYGLPPQDIAKLSNSMKIALNASTVTEEFLQELLHFGLKEEQTEAWHNFYPRPETGLAMEYVKEKNAWFKQFGIRTMAFIAGDKEKRGPIFQGLPTLEAHRYIRPLQAYLELVKCYTDKVLVGDVSTEDKSMEQLAQANYGIIPLQYTPFTQDEILLNKIEAVHTNRLDPARDVIRSVESRAYASVEGMRLLPLNTIERARGSVTIDNTLYGRYAGELQITTTDLPQNSKVNVIGKVKEEDLPLLSYIGAGQRFLLQRMKQEGQ